MTKSFFFFYFHWHTWNRMGCSRKNPHTPWWMEFWKFSWEGRSKTLEIHARGGGGGLNWKKKKLARGSLLTTTSVKKIFEELSAFPSVRLHQILTVHSGISVWTEAMMHWNLKQFYVHIYQPDRFWFQKPLFSLECYGSFSNKHKVNIVRKAVVVF